MSSSTPSSIARCSPGTTFRSGRCGVRWGGETALDLDGYTPTRFLLDDALAAFASVERGEGLKTVLEIR